MMRSLKSLLQAGLGLVYPEWCQVCRDAPASAAQSFVCASCRGTVRLIQPPFCARCGMPFQGAISQAFECGNCRGEDMPFTYARSAAVARGTLLEIIHRYKYQRAVWFERFLGELLVRAAAPGLCEGGWDVIVPVPLHATKLREREFNQAERLARHLSRATGIPVENGLVVRRVATRSQTLLSKEERRENVGKAFGAGRAAGVQGGRMVVVDDVYTTGATTGACAKVLRGQGAAEVCVWTVARGV